VQDNTRLVPPLVFHLAPTHLGRGTQRQIHSSVQGPPGSETPTRFHKKKNGKAYIVGDWLTDIESSSGSSSSEEEDDEKVTAIAGDFSSPLSSPSSTSRLCLMAKGERKVQNENDIVEDCDSDSDDE
jgi:hypothetical protein